MTHDQKPGETEDKRHTGPGALYDIQDLARAHGFTVAHALRLIEEHGNSRAALDAAADRLKAKIAAH